MNSTPTPEESKQSIEDVLVSIREALQHERDTQPDPTLTATDDADEDDDMLVLSPAMLEHDAKTQPASTVSTAHESSSGQNVSLGSINQRQGSHAGNPEQIMAVGDQEAASSLLQGRNTGAENAFSVAHARQTDLLKKARNMSDSLSIPLSDETISDTGSAFAVLQKTLQEKYLKEYEERKVAVNNEGSLTVEDIVRQEVRTFLKKWLNAHLPAIVQASVREEIERLTQRGL